MEFRPLRAFVEVVRQGGFTRAAETVFATQSTISKSVRQLEEELGAPLLDRVGHGFTLTAFGEVVYRRGLQLLADRDSLLAELDEIRGLTRGTLRVGIPPIGSSHLFAPVFTLYRKRFPGIEVQLSEHGSDRLEELLHAGALDLAASLLPSAEDLESQPVRREPLVALLPPDHPLAGSGASDISILREMPFILFEEGFALNRIILTACRARGFTPQIIARSSQIDFITELAATGLGVAFLPRMIAEERRRSAIGKVLMDHADTDWDMAMLWRQNAFLPHAARAWLDCVREVHGPRS